MTTASVYIMPWSVSIGFKCRFCQHWCPALWNLKVLYLALMVLFRTFNIHGTFPWFFMVEKGSSDFKNVFQTKEKMGLLGTVVHWKVLWEIENSSCGIAAKKNKTFGAFILMCELLLFYVFVDWRVILDLYFWIIVVRSLCWAVLIVLLWWIAALFCNCRSMRT